MYFEMERRRATYIYDGLEQEKASTENDGNITTLPRMRTKMIPGNLIYIQVYLLFPCLLEDLLKLPLISFPEYTII